MQGEQSPNEGEPFGGIHRIDAGVKGMPGPSGRVQSAIKDLRGDSMKDPARSDEENVDSFSLFPEALLLERDPAHLLWEEPAHGSANQGKSQQRAEPAQDGSRDRFMSCDFSAIFSRATRDCSFLRFEKGTSLGEGLRNFARLEAGAARALGPPAAFTSDDRRNLLDQGSGLQFRPSGQQAQRPRDRPGRYSIRRERTGPPNCPLTISTTA